MRLIWSRVGSISPLSQRETVAWLTSAIAAKADWVIPKMLRRMFSIGFMTHKYTHAHYISKENYTYANFYRRNISDMQIRMTILGENIKALRAGRRLSQTAFGELVGVTQPTISRLEAGGDAETETLARIAALAGVSIEHLRERQISEYQANHEKGPIYRDRLKPDIEPAPPAEGSREPPFLGLIPGVEKMSILAGKSLEWSEMVVELAPVERVARPWFLGEVKEAFGLIVSTENMLPVTEAGDTVIVNEKLPLRRTREALFCSAKENNVFRAILARFIGQTQSHWTIEEDSPGTGEDGKRILPKADWPDAFPVVAKIIGR